jgi:hypothetical protein
MALIMTHFVIHCRTPEEAREQFVSDIQRHISRLQREQQHVTGVEASRLARAIDELEQLFEYWSIVEIKFPRRQRRQSDAARIKTILDDDVRSEVET